MDNSKKNNICQFIELFGYNEDFEFYIFNYFVENDAKDPDVKEVFDFITSNKEYSKYIGVMFMGIIQRQYIEKERDDLAKEPQKAILVDASSKAYDVVVKKFNQLAKELNISDSLSLSNLFTYMLFTGSFSVTSEHKYKIEDRLVLPGHFAFDIFSGGGVCLNYSDMLTDILVDSGIDAATILNKMDNSVEFNYRPELKREVSKEKFSSRLISFLATPLSNKLGNHACTLICENGKNPYIYDATNLTMFECLSKREAICKIGSGTISLKPYFSTLFISNDVNYNTLKKLCLTDKFTSPYSRKDFICAWEEGIETFGTNKSLIGDYHEDVYGEIKSIADNAKLLLRSKKKSKDIKK